MQKITGVSIAQTDVKETKIGSAFNFYRLPELFNDQKEMYGYDSPACFLERYGNMEVTSFISAVEMEIQKFKGNAALRDDISLIAIKKLNLFL